MKITTTFLATALVCASATLPSLGAADNQATQVQQGMDALYPHAYRASDVLGRTVTDARSLNLGRIGDLVLDTRTGQVLFAIVSTGGVFGIGDTTRAVPIAAFETESGPKSTVRLDVDSPKWAAAPRFVPEETALLANDDNAAELHRYYDESWNAPPERLDANGRPLRREVTLASWMKGKAVGAGDRGIGEIDDVLVSKDLRQAAVLFNPLDEYTGNSESYVLPFSRFSIGEVDPDAITAKVSPQDLREAPLLEDERWARASSPGIYRWGNRVADENQNSTRDVADSAGPADGGRIAANVAPPLESVRRAIQGDSELRDAAQSVDVFAQSNRLIVRGTVPNEEVKDKVLDRAESAAHGWRVDDQLQVERR